MMISLIDRFMAKISPEPNSGCWLWCAAIGASGYGKLGLGARGRGWSPAHRIAWELFCGPINGMQVLHKCDVRECVNPDHLFLGTQKDNMLDMSKKGRNYPLKSLGVENGRARLSEINVRSIRASSKPHAEIAAEYGLAVKYVGRVRRRETWRHVF